MTSRRGRRGLVAASGIIAGLLLMSSVAWACQAFRGRANWEGNGVAGGSSDGANGDLHGPAQGGTWDLTTDGIGAAGQAHRNCYDEYGQELPGVGLDSSTNSNWYPATGGVAPRVRMVAGSNGADLALKIEPSPVCLDNNVVPGINKMPVLSGTNGYEVYTAQAEGPGLNGNSAPEPNACHLRSGTTGGARVSPANAVKINASGYSVDGSGNPTTYVLDNFRAGGTAGTVRMICLWDDSGETSDAQAINVNVISL